MKIEDILNIDYALVAIIGATNSGKTNLMIKMIVDAYVKAEPILMICNEGTSFIHNAVLRYLINNNIELNVAEVYELLQSFNGNRNLNNKKTIEELVKNTKGKLIFIDNLALLHHGFITSNEDTTSFYIMNDTTEFLNTLARKYNKVITIGVASNRDINKLPISGENCDIIFRIDSNYKVEELKNRFKGVSNV
jgi:GTPase SAR1 family protein